MQHATCAHDGTVKADESLIFFRGILFPRQRTGKSRKGASELRPAARSALNTLRKRNAKFECKMGTFEEKSPSSLDP